MRITLERTDLPDGETEGENHGVLVVEGGREMTVPLGSGRSPRKKSANVITTISGPTDPGRLFAASSTSSPRRRAQHVQRNRLDRRRINTEPAGHAPRLLILRRVPFSHAVVLLSILNLLSLICSPRSSAGAVYL